MMSSETLLKVENLCTEFETLDGVVRAVDRVSLSIRPGETVGIVGKSGSGKSITARSIMRLIAPPGRIVGGSIRYRGDDLAKASEARMRGVRGAEISMIFQDPMTYLNPIMTLGAQLCEVIREHRGLRGTPLRQAAIAALRQARVPTPERTIDYYPHQLSGGQRQRVLIAIAIACSPSLLIADEPTTALDVTIQAQILQLLKNLVAETQTALLLITHDLGVIADICDRVYVMYAGQIVEEGETMALFDNPRHPYTQGLLRSALPIADSNGEFPAIAGSVPNLRTPPMGCRFHPRCPHIMPKCRAEDPRMVIQKPGENAACWLYDVGGEKQ